MKKVFLSFQKLSRNIQEFSEKDDVIPKEVNQQRGSFQIYAYIFLLYSSQRVVIIYDMRCGMRKIGSVLFLLLVGVSDVFSTVVVRTSFNEQAKSADLVVMGKVIRVENIEISGFPFSRALLSVEEVIAGSPAGSEIGILQAGGVRRSGGRAIVAGVRYLRVGDEVLLMLRSRPDGNYEIIGLNQGHYPVIIERRTGRKVITFQEGGRKKYLTLDSAKRRIHAVRENSAGERGGKR